VQLVSDQMKRLQKKLVQEEPEQISVAWQNVYDATLLEIQGNYYFSLVTYQYIIKQT